MKGSTMKALTVILLALTVTAYADRAETHLKAGRLLEVNGYDVSVSQPRFTPATNPDGFTLSWVGPATSENWTMTDVDAVVLPADYVWPTPRVLQQLGEIEVQTLVLQSYTNNAVGYEVFIHDDGTLDAIIDHASPRRSEADKNLEKDTRKALRDTRKASAIAKGDQSKTDATRANSVPALRAAVVLLQEQIEEMQKIMGIRP